MLYLEQGTYLEFVVSISNPLTILGISQETLDTVHPFTGPALLDDVENVDAVAKDAHDF